MKKFDPHTRLKAIPVSDYANQNPTVYVPKENGQAIDLAAENKEASQFILMNKNYLASRAYQLIIVPGFTPVNATTPSEITQNTIRRLERAVHKLNQFQVPVVIVSGGNVHPNNTPYNEAYGMKQYLMNHLGLKNYQVAIDPYARHSTTNLRNAGRFLLAHGLNRALIVTSLGQSFYYSFPLISTFNSRCVRELGYKLGKLRWRSTYTTLFIPSGKVMTKGTDSKDV